MNHYKIKINGKECDASEYQDKIIDCVIHGQGDILINAAAGASKTTTIVNCMNYISEKEKIAYIAFNKEIVESINKKLDGKNNISVMTYHSLGYSILTENIDNLYNKEPDEYKYKNYIKSNISNLTSKRILNSLGKEKQTYINNIINLVDYSRYYNVERPSKIREVAKIYGIAILKDEIDVCRKVLVWGKNNLDTFDFTDMIWIPVNLNFKTKRKKFDWIMIDEAQDTSIIEKELLSRCKKRGARCLIVGDENQQINVWCGSSEEAIQSFKGKNCNEFELPISYRCSKKVIELAKKFSNSIIPSDNAIEGSINIDVSEYLVQPGDMVLCRNTAPLITLQLEYIKRNIPSYIRGIDKIKENYINLINECKSINIDKQCITSDGLFPKLYKKLFSQIEMLIEKNGLTENEALFHRSIFTLYDNINGLKALSEGRRTVKELIEKIDAIYENEDRNCVQLSTVHKAKGLEADNVYLLMPSLIPSKMAKKEWEKKTEKNLMYVAITRAKKTFNFIREDNSRMYQYNGMLSLNEMKKELNEIKQRINFNTEYGIKEIKKDNIEIRCSLGEKNVLGETNTVIRNNGKTKKAASKMKCFLE